MTRTLAVQNTTETDSNEWKAPGTISTHSIVYAINSRQTAHLSASYGPFKSQQTYRGLNVKLYLNGYISYIW